MANPGPWCDHEVLSRLCTLRNLQESLRVLGHSHPTLLGSIWKPSKLFPVYRRADENIAGQQKASSGPQHFLQPLCILPLELNAWSKGPFEQAVTTWLYSGFASRGPNHLASLFLLIWMDDWMMGFWECEERLPGTSFLQGQWTHCLHNIGPLDIPLNTCWSWLTPLLAWLRMRQNSLKGWARDPETQSSLLSAAPIALSWNSRWCLKEDFCRK